MKQNEMRKIAAGAARSYLRKMGIDPANRPAESGLLALDDLSRLDSDLIASIWYVNASDNQIKLFKREWAK